MYRDYAEHILFKRVGEEYQRSQERLSSRPNGFVMVIIFRVEVDYIDGRRQRSSRRRKNAGDGGVEVWK